MRNRDRLMPDYGIEGGQAMKTMLITTVLVLATQPCLGMFCGQGVISEGDNVLANPPV